MTTDDVSSRKISRIVAVVFIIFAAWLAPGTVLAFALRLWIIAAALGLVLVLTLALAVRFARPRRTRRRG